METSATCLLGARVISHNNHPQVWGGERGVYRVLVQPKTWTGLHWGQGQGAWTHGETD